MKPLKYTVFSIFLLTTIGLTSCSDDADSNAPCPLTVDTVKVLQTKELNGTKYFLVKRITGWHDKVIVVQLFDKQPELGPCNEDIVMPVFEDSIETDESSVTLRADIKNKEYKFVYADKPSLEHSITLEFEE